MASVYAGDLDNATYNAVLFCRSSCTNIPDTGVTGDGGLLVTAAMNSTSCTQMYVTIKTHKVFVRSINGGTWSNWVEV